MNQINDKLTPQQRFEKKNLRYFSFKFHKTLDSDIIQALEDKKNMQGYIKELIRQDIKKLTQ